MPPGCALCSQTLCRSPLLHKVCLRCQADGADVVIALTHMRVPNDQLLAASVPEFDLVLGGHDHERWEELVEPHGVQLVKSGGLT